MVKIASWLGIVAAVLGGALLAFGLLPAAVYVICRGRCVGGEDLLVVVLAAGVFAACAFAALRFVKRWHMRVLFLLLAAFAVDPLQHTLTVWLF